MYTGYKHDTVTCFRVYKHYVSELYNDKFYNVMLQLLVALSVLYILLNF